MTIEDVLRDALCEADRRPVAPPDVAGLARRLARHDRMVVTRRIAVAGGGLAAAVAVAVGTVGDARGETVDVRPADAPPVTEDAPATTTTTTTTAAPATTAPPVPIATAPAPPPAATPVTAAPAPPATTAPAPAPEPAPTVAWSAQATWGSCDLDPPYDEYHGTAEPGTVVSVTSPYGSGSTTAGADGHWYVKVEFPGAPVGETFGVNVSSAQGSATFEFTRTA